MLKSIRIINFESHKDSTFQFDEKFNAIIGESDSGKTSSIRALTVAAFNRWTPDMARINTNDTQIILTCTKGIIHVFKNNKRNAFKVTELLENGDTKIHKFESVGTSCPDIVQKITGLGTLDMSGITDLPNFIFQLDSHYMLSSIDGKNCSSNMVARIIDNVIGLGGMEDLINLVSADGATAKRKLTSNTNRITELKNELHDEYDIEDKKRLLIKAKQLNEKINNAKQLLEDNKKWLIDWTKIVDKLKVIEIALKDNDDVEKIVELNKTTNDKLKTFNAVIEIDVKTNSINNKLNNCIAQLEKLPNVLLIKAIISDVQVLSDKANSLKTYNDNYSLKEIKLKRVGSEIVTGGNIIDELNIELTEIKIKHPQCPICGKDWD